jgi:nicotinamidase-related amidase
VTSAEAAVEPDGPGGPLLGVIDMQRLFGDPSSPWFAPRDGEIVNHVDRLVQGFDDRVVFTRFLVPDHPQGSWVPYYELWSRVTTPEAMPLLELTEPWGSRRATLDRTTFSKWGSELREAAGPSRTLVLCGVATDCCVIATALPASDDGMFVRVVADACAGASDQAHDAALTVCSGFAPQIEVTTVDTELARRGSRLGPTGPA